MCVDGTGKFDVKILDPCYKMKDFPNGVATIDTSNLKELLFEPTAYRIQGELRFKTQEEQDMYDEIGLRVTGSSGEELVFTEYDTDDIQWESNWKLYSIWVDSDFVDRNGGKVMVSPFAIEKDSVMMFNPLEKEVQLFLNKCASGGNFKMTLGQIVKGQVTPPVAGCKVTI